MPAQDTVVGFVGLGTMGSALSAHLLAAGWRVAGYDIDPARLAAHTGRGGETATGPAGAAAGDVVVTSLPTAQALLDVTSGEAGLAARHGQGFDGLTAERDAGQEWLVHRRGFRWPVPLILHPYYVGARPGLADFYLTNLIGNPLATTLCAARLIFSGTLDELGALRLVLPHGGGYLPYQIGRLDHGHQVRRNASDLFGLGLPG